MGTKRVGLARTEALLENLKREIVLGVGSSLAGGRKKIEALTNTSALTLVLTEAAYPSGTAFACDFSTNGQAVDITLPAATAGLSYTFLAQATNGTGASTVTLSGPSAIVQGVLVCDDATKDAAGTNIVFDHSKFIAGTMVEFICDGTKWNVRATCLCDQAEVTVS
jgi:hypothetical protein